MKLNDGVELCRIIEAFCPQFGCHVALTGGCLYKDGDRKDIDILFYSVRQSEMDRDGLSDALLAAGLEIIGVHGWMQKMRWRGVMVDVFFPETPKTSSDEYRRRDETDPDHMRELAYERREAEAALACMPELINEDF